MTQISSNEPFKLSPETQETMDWLRNIKHGECFTLDQLNEAMHYDIHKKRHHLSKALLKLHPDGYVFRSTPGVGYERLTPDQAVKYIKEGGLSRFRAANKLMRVKLEGQDPSVLSPNALQDYAAAMVELTMREAISTSQVTRSISGHVSRANQSDISPDLSKGIFEQLAASGFKG